MQEIIRFDPDIVQMIHDGNPLAEIRDYIVREKGEMLMGHVAVEKVAALLFSPQDVYEKVLLEEGGAAASTPALPDSSVAPQEPQSDRRASILVMDDDKVSLTMIQEHLEKQGYEVIPAADGIEALLQLGKHNFALILSDIHMPNLDGFKLLELIHQKNIKTPVIFLTAQSGEAEEIRGLQLGAVDYLRKPIHKDLLLLRLKSVLRM